MAEIAKADFLDQSGADQGVGLRRSSSGQPQQAGAPTPTIVLHFFIGGVQHGQ